MNNPLCKCGCGEHVSKPTNRYINGHNYRGKVGQFKGKKHTPETRKKMSESTKGQIPWNKGVPNCHSPETLKKIRDANTKNGIWGTGTDSYCPIFRNKEFRTIIYKRDSYTCLMCGCTRQLNFKLYGHKNLSIHHIDHDKQNCDLRNCVSSCVYCNAHVENRKIKKYYEQYLSELVTALYY